MTRYARQARFNEFGEVGQEHLSAMHVLIIGAGALGSHTAEMLVRMGVNHLTVIDMDIVELSNLHRQAVYDEEDVSALLPKVEALKEKLRRVNSSVQVDALYEEVTNTNMLELLERVQPDIIMDGMDNFKMRYLINEAAIQTGIPWIYGAVVGSKGSVYAFDHTGPCLKCLFGSMPETAESCAINGILPPVVQQVASIQVSELLRYASTKGFSKLLITVDSFDMQFKTLNVDALKNADCEICTHYNYQLLNQNEHSPIEDLCGDATRFRFNPQAFDYANLIPGTLYKSNSFAKMIRYEDYTFTLFKDGRMNVHGLTENSEAKKLYDLILKSLK
ncbi:ThiF family adenylyltransferase [Staphylococcus sp. SQ8-PEA]|uniref:ThiF family adenylyltransferase n=1 Tax=Staphylococcus marylandisciuri TaxID=2981529 RepID=A0ABT2QQL1_9STAP|nr:ThiF family adenylyltransferase [Staphylococcus marylandisciuri]MCU5746275.1 ThiF family adenylyltransferase [Staphylococcus marylandisciuri]